GVSELETGFARCIGNRAYTSVILVAGAVEDHFGDRNLLAAFRNVFAELLRGADVALARSHRGSRRERLAALVGDDLHVEVTVGAKHRQARPRVGAEHLLANPLPSLIAADSSVFRNVHRLFPDCLP